MNKFLTLLVLVAFSTAVMARGLEFEDSMEDTQVDEAAAEIYYKRTGQNPSWYNEAVVAPGLTSSARVVDPPRPVVKSVQRTVLAQPVVKAAPVVKVEPAPTRLTLVAVQEDPTEAALARLGLPVATVAVEDSVEAALVRLGVSPDTPIISGSNVNTLSRNAPSSRYTPPAPVVHPARSSPASRPRYSVPAPVVYAAQDEPTAPLSGIVVA